MIGEWDEEEDKSDWLTWLLFLCVTLIEAFSAKLANKVSLSPSLSLGSSLLDGKAPLIGLHLTAKSPCLTSPPSCAQDDWIWSDVCLLLNNLSLELFEEEKIDGGGRERRMDRFWCFEWCVCWFNQCEASICDDKWNRKKQPKYEPSRREYIIEKLAINHCLSVSFTRETYHCQEVNQQQREPLSAEEREKKENNDLFLIRGMSCFLCGERERFY